ALHLAWRFAPKKKTSGPPRSQERAGAENVEGYGAPWSGRLMMPNVEYALASGHSARYLDVSPMIEALRFQPSDFEFAHGWLNHVPSRHRFQFDRKGRVTIDALCGCAALSVRPEQADSSIRCSRPGASSIGCPWSRTGSSLRTS